MFEDIVHIRVRREYECNKKAGIYRIPASQNKLVVIPFDVLQLLFLLLCYQYAEVDRGIFNSFIFCQAQIKCSLFSGHWYVIFFAVAAYDMYNSFQENLPHFNHVGLRNCFTQSLTFTGQASTSLHTPSPLSSLHCVYVITDDVLRYTTIIPYGCFWAWNKSLHDWCPRACGALIK